MCLTLPWHSSHFSMREILAPILLDFEWIKSNAYVKCIKEYWSVSGSQRFLSEKGSTRILILALWVSIQLLRFAGTLKLINIPDQTLYHWNLYDIISLLS